jgi:hypothetical protein
MAGLREFRARSDMARRVPVDAQATLPNTEN